MDDLREIITEASHSIGFADDDLRRAHSKAVELGRVEALLLADLIEAQAKISARMTEILGYVEG